MISEFPLLVFSVFTGIAAGAYFISLFFSEKETESKRSWLFPALCALLLGVGLLGTLTHLQHPERFLNAMANPTAMITQEAYWSIGFGGILVIDALLSRFRNRAPRILRIAGAITASGLMVVTSLAYVMSIGVAAWRGIATFPLFLVGDLAMGAVLYATFNKDLYRKKAFVITNIVIEVLLAATFIALAVQFKEAMIGILPVVVALVIAPVAVISLSVLTQKDKMSLSLTSWIALSCVGAGIVIARYAFYAACPF
jgi:anaerobic dimethyl sulfoxide reductase subunit C (anchor subunit)